MIKIIASDLDGTLLNEKSVISEETQEMIRKSQKAGIRWIIATGRSMKTAGNLVKQAGIRCDYVLLNGAEFRKNDGTLICQKSISKVVAEKIIQMLFQKELNFELNTNKGDFSTDCELCNTAKPITKEELKQKDLDIQKIFVFSDYEKELESIKPYIYETTDITITSSASWNIEITGKYADKGNMLKTAIDYYGIDKEEILVFGDGENDKVMFERFPHSRAMGNASEELKRIAEKVIETNKECGVAKEVKRLLSREVM